jgi:hypothetical protein
MIGRKNCHCHVHPRENHFLRDGVASVLDNAFRSPPAIELLIVMMTGYGGRCRGGGSYEPRTATPEVITAAMLHSSFISLKMEAASSSETLVTIYQTVRPPIAEYQNL